MIYPNTGFPAVQPEAAGARVRAPSRNDPDHPARRLADLGPRAVSTRELLTLVLDCGRGLAWADEAAGRLACSDPARVGLRPLGAMAVPALARAGRLGPRAAARVVAALELGRRAAAEMRPEADRIVTARFVYELLRLRMRDLRQEEFHVLLLNTQGRLLRDVTISVGTLDAALVHAREVFRAAITEGAASVVLAHNHPSGEPYPSPADKAVTVALVSAGELIGIPVTDHVIVGEGRYFSFLEEGLLNTRGNGVAAGSSLSTSRSVHP